MHLNRMENSSEFSYVHELFSQSRLHFIYYEVARPSNSLLHRASVWFFGYLILSKCVFQKKHYRLCLVADLIDRATPVYRAAGSTKKHSDGDGSVFHGSAVATYASRVFWRCLFLVAGQRVRRGYLKTTTWMDLEHHIYRTICDADQGTTELTTQSLITKSACSLLENSPFLRVQFSARRIKNS